MLTAPVVEEVAIVRVVPEGFRYRQESHNRYDLIFNEPHKRSHKSTQFIIYQNYLLNIGIEIEKIKNLYNSYKKILKVDFNTFSDAYVKMTETMNSIIPIDCTVETDVSEEDECLYNYYEFDDKKIIFNLFFDEDEKYTVALINLKTREKFLSIEGSIEKAVDCLRKNLENDTNV